MPDKIENISNLIDKHLKDELTEVERRELDLWLSESEENRIWFDQINKREVLSQKLVEFASTDKESVWQKTVNRINADGNVIRMYPKRVSWQRYVAAAAVVIMLSAGAWLYLKQSTPKESGQPVIVSNQLKNKIVPGSDKATLRLPDNSIVALEKDDVKTIFQDGKTSISVANGQLLYKKQRSGTVQQANQYNLVTTPKGGKFKVILPDGSKVWLNAASSLRFPIVFAGNERNVQLTGEAYFEVASMSSEGQKMPFKVDIRIAGKESGKVEVFGTHFNIMAYGEEATVQTTLLEGSVKVTAPNTNGQDNGTFIKPDQQAQLEKGQIDVVNVDDAARFASWKDGTFPADNIETVIRQIARWYNVAVRYEGSTPERELGGKIRSDISFDAVLKTLESLNIHTKMEGDTLIIM